MEISDNNTGRSSALEWFVNGNEYFRKGKLDNALESYSKAVDADPTFAAAWFKKGEVSRFQENYEEAIKSLDRSIEYDPANPVPWDVRGDLLERMGRIDAAMECYNKINEIAPDFRGNWYAKSRTMRLLHIEKDPEAVVNKEPKSAEDWISKGDALYRLERDGSKECYKKATQIDPNNAEAWRSLSRSTFGMAWDDRTLALEYCNKALSIDPNDDDSWYWRGYYSSRVTFVNEEGQHPRRDVIPSFKKAAELNPRHRRAWSELGHYYLLRNRYLEAIESFDKHLDQLPDADKEREERLEARIRLGLEVGSREWEKWEGWVAEARRHFDSANYGEAASCFEKAGNYLDAATCYEKAGNEEKEIFCYGQVGYPEEAWYRKAVHHLQSGENDKAETAFNKIIESNFEWQWLDGVSSPSVLRRADEISCYFDNFVQSNPMDARSWLRKGIAMYSLDRFGEMRLCITKAIALEPAFAANWKKYEMSTALHWPKVSPS